MNEWTKINFKKMEDNISILNFFMVIPVKYIDKNNTIYVKI